MKTQAMVPLAAAALFLSAALSFGEVKVVTDFNPEGAAAFKFKNVPSPSRTDAAAKGRFTIVSGEQDPAGGDVVKLNDGNVPNEQDQPDENFFFNAGTEGGRLQLDLGSVIEVSQINTYSWHPDTRGPQVYKLYASDGQADGFNPKPETNPLRLGWILITNIDTRPKSGQGGGQYGVSISDTSGVLGKFRYLLFDCTRTETDDDFGNTFYSEIDVIEKGATVAGSTNSAEAEPAKPTSAEFKAEGGGYEFTIDTAAAPDLTDWATKELAPVAGKWYPKIVSLLPSDGYEAPKHFSIIFKNETGGNPAYANGAKISCNSDWFRKNLKGEAIGSVVHEMTHVVQHYGGRARRGNRPPGWLVEGIPDYIRWFVYEPETHGAEINTRNFSRARYDASYRVTGNFLNWVVTTYDKDLIRKLNAALRDGEYDEALWKTCTGKSVEELGAEWKDYHARRLNLRAPPKA